MALDVIFISFDEPNANINYQKLQTIAPYAKRVHGVSGIANAHYTASKLSDTRLFYVVDGDSEVLPSFDFDFKPEKWDQDYVHIWQARNPVNGLSYGYGGVKLFNKRFFKPGENLQIDFSTSLTKDVKYINEVGSITRFNSDEFRAFRGAFRECAKLASNVITGENCQETLERLDIWCCTANGQTFYEDYVLLGAKAGRAYGEAHTGNKVALMQINDYNWLKAIFDKERNK